MSLRFLVVGTWMWPWYEQACADALKTLGCSVQKSSWLDDFYCWEQDRGEPVSRSTLSSIQNRFVAGPIVRRLNARILLEATDCNPDVIWFFNATHILPSTIHRLRRSLPSTIFLQYANDNPFGGGTNRLRFRHLRRAIPQFDVHFVYRLSNIDDFTTAGAKKARLLRSYYIPGEDYRMVPQLEKRSFLSDIVFAGHYEDDRRSDALESLARLGVRLNLFGGGWQHKTPREHTPRLAELQPVVPVVGDDYRMAISGAKIALSFLSKLNRDTYTRRNFQIPAMGTFMLSEYSEDLAGLFQEGVEAEFFRSHEELIDKVTYYLGDGLARERIAQRGRDRVLRDGHDVVSRMRDLLVEVASLGGIHETT